MRVTLNQTWLYAGKFYGPGAVELPSEIADALAAKGAFDQPTSAPSGESGTDLTPQITPPLPADLLQKLADGGFTSGEAISAASDAELLAVKGIGRASLRDIRQAYGGGDADPE